MLNSKTRVVLLHYEDKSDSHRQMSDSFVKRKHSSELVRYYPLEKKITVSNSVNSSQYHRVKFYVVGHGQTNNRLTLANKTSYLKIVSDIASVLKCHQKELSSNCFIEVNLMICGVANMQHQKGRFDAAKHDIQTSLMYRFANCLKLYLNRKEGIRVTGSYMPIQASSGKHLYYANEHFPEPCAKSSAEEHSKYFMFKVYWGKLMHKIYDHIYSSIKVRFKHTTRGHYFTNEEAKEFQNFICNFDSGKYRLLFEDLSAAKAGLTYLYYDCYLKHSLLQEKVSKLEICVTGGQLQVKQLYGAYSGVRLDNIIQHNTATRSSDCIKNLVNSSQVIRMMV